MFAELNKYKHLPPAEFDAKLAAILKAQDDERRALLAKQGKKKPMLKKVGGK